eukprot:TRINITY_DN3690_c0_g1_i3.p1 TRINITY_DN3690_c0_g1~~TRINITY_DN3690_c0_g1_i3.p1  ORF type:complete len:238 (+),score=32.95 TRINITY_DN3690_c0_g1_i3:62-715(+)
MCIRDRYMGTHFLLFQDFILCVCVWYWKKMAEVRMTEDLRQRYQEMIEKETDGVIDSREKQFADLNADYRKRCRDIAPDDDKAFETCTNEKGIAIQREIMALETRNLANAKGLLSCLTTAAVVYDNSEEMLNECRNGYRQNLEVIVDQIIKNCKAIQWPLNMNKIHGYTPLKERSIVMCAGFLIDLQTWTMMQSATLAYQYEQLELSLRWHRIYTLY